MIDAERAAAVLHRERVGVSAGLVQRRELAHELPRAQRVEMYRVTMIKPVDTEAVPVHLAIKVAVAGARGKNLDKCASIGLTPAAFDSRD